MPFQLTPAASQATPVALNKAIILFGRHPECDVVITSSRKVSRKHCAIAQVDHSFVVRDLGSMNGVRVNGKSVKGSTTLKVGDELIVGDVVFHMEVAAANGQVKKTPTPQKPNGATAKPMPRHMISQDIPVIIPDEEESFAIEESMVKSPTDSEIPVVLSKDAIIDDNSDDEIEIVE